jgi:GTPase SAR1 family protein
MDKIKKKVLVLGEAGVGKSTLVQTYCTNGQQLTKDYVMTLVADIASKIIEVDDEHDVELFFFDVSGREMLRTAVAQMVCHCYIAH